MADIITVNYTHVDGAHFFTANDELSHGLCVAHQDAEVAFYETAVQLKILLKLNHELDCEVEPAITFQEFSEAVLEPQRKTRNHIRTTRVRSEIDWKKARKAA